MLTSMTNFGTQTNSVDWDQTAIPWAVVWLCGHWLLIVLIVWTLNSGCVEVGFLLYGRWILVGWMLGFGCLDVGFGCEVVERWTLVERTLDFGGCMFDLTLNWINVPTAGRSRPGTGSTSSRVIRCSWRSHSTWSDPSDQVTKVIMLKCRKCSTTLNPNPTNLQRWSNVRCLLGRDVLTHWREPSRVCGTGENSILFYQSMLIWFDCLPVMILTRTNILGPRY